MASGDSLNTFIAQGNQPPAANFATLNLRNSHPVLEFDAATNQDAVFASILPRQYGGGGITVSIHWAGATATSGDVVWLAQFEALAANGQDLDADGFAATQTSTGTANGTSGKLTYTTIAFTDGAQMDSIAVGQSFRIKVTRNAAAGGDTMTGLAQLLDVELIET